MQNQGKPLTVKQAPAPQSVAAPQVEEEWWASLLAEEARWGDGGAPAEPPPAEILSLQQEPDWERVARIFKQDEVVEARVYGCNQGGLLVENEILRGFVPVSHLQATTQALQDGTLPADWENGRASRLVQPLLERHVGHTLRLKVIECDQKRGRIVLSEHAARAAPGQRVRLLQTIRPGQHLRGKVTNVTRFGAFVDLGGLEGLIHISELSWGRVQHPSHIVQVGQEVEVHVVRVERENRRVALSLKRLHPNPWESVAERYRVGQVVAARITTVVSFGAFARVEEGLDGLIHISEMPANGNDSKPRPRDVVREGEVVNVRIVHIDPVRQRLGLSLLVD